MMETDLEITIGKDKVLDKIGIELIIEGMDIRKISVEMMAEIEVEVLTEAIVVLGVDEEKEAYPPGGIIIIIMIIIIGKMAALDLDQGLEADLTQE